MRKENSSALQEVTHRAGGVSHAQERLLAFRMVNETAIMAAAW